MKNIKKLAIATMISLSALSMVACQKTEPEIKIERDIQGTGIGEYKGDVEVTLSPTTQQNIENTKNETVETKETVDYRYQKTPEEIEEEKRAQEAYKKELEALAKAQAQQPQDTTGTDKNGHPYLQPGASYTFGADGKPIEAPPKGQDTAVITDPATGKKYSYAFESWVVNTTAEQNARREAIRDNKMDAQGNTDIRTLTKEEASQIKFNFD